MKSFIQVLVILKMLNACAPADVKEPIQITEQEQPSRSVEQETVLAFDARCAGSEVVVIPSIFEEKLNPLQKLKYQYQPSEIKKIQLDSSVFYHLQEIKRAKYYGDYWSNIEIEIQGLSALVSQITKAERAGVKGRVPISGKLYPRAIISMYSFSSIDCAQTAERYLAWIDRVGPWPEGTYEKTPHIFFRDDQIVYHIIGGGEFMRDYLPEIEMTLKNSLD